MTKFPQTFLVTCKRGLERAHATAKHFADVGIDVAIFDGIDGRTFGLRTELTHGRQYIFPPEARMSAGQVGNTLSHYMLWKCLQYFPQDEFLIVEDDSQIDDVATFLEQFAAAYDDLPAKWQIAFVGHFATEKLKIERVTDRIGVAQYPLGIHAYLVKRDALDWMLSTNHQARVILDIQLAENSLPWMRCYTFTPSLVSQKTQTGDWPSIATGPAVEPAMDWQAIQGWFHAPDLYAQAVKGAKDGDIFVTVGAWKGQDVAFMVQAIADSGKTIEYWAVDNFQGGGFTREMVNNLVGQGQNLYDVFEHNVKACGWRNKVRVKIADSVAAAADFPDRGVAFCYLDSDHSQEQVEREIQAWLPKIKPGGQLAGDDFDTPGVEAAVRKAFGDGFRTNDQKYRSWIVDVK